MKYSHFVPLSHLFTAHQVALAYVDNVFKLHGLSLVIMSDWDPVFTSRLWRELIKLCETERAMSYVMTPVDIRTYREGESVPGDVSTMLGPCLSATMEAPFVVG
jgi:hypothetical protein